MNKLTLTLFLLLITEYGFSQIAAYSGKSSPSATAASNASATALSRGSGLGTGSGASFNSNNWTTTSTAGDAITNNDYIEWTITANSGYTVNVTSIEIDYDRSGSGPSKVFIRTSSDSYGSDIFSDASVSSSGEENTISSLNLTSANGGAITFRLYGYGASSTGGTFDIEDDLGTTLGTADIGIILNGSINSAGSVDDPTSFSASVQSDTQINLSWTDNSNGDDVLVAWNSSNTFGTPSDGSTYSSGNSISGGGTVLQYNSTDSYSHTGLTSNTAYYYKSWSYDGSNYSSGTTTNGTTLKPEPTNHPTNVSVTSTYQNITITWTDAVAGSQAPDGYLILGETDNNITNPSDGTAVSNDTDASDNTLGYNVTHGSGASHTFSNLSASTSYFFEIFSYTNSGSNIDYKTDGTIVAGNTSTGTTPSVVFNEIHYNPSSSQGDDNAYEFLELYNYGGSDVDISGWTISNGLSYTIPNSTTLSAGGYLILAVNSSNYSGSLDWGSGGLSNGGEQITLSDASSNVIDDLTYDDNSTWGTGADGSGSSLELISASSDNSDGSNWEISGMFGGTPGRANRSVQISGTAGFRMLSAPVSNGTYTDLLSELWTQGMTGSDAAEASGDNVWIWTVGSGGAGSWSVVSDLGNTMTAGAGILVYAFADNNNDGTDDLPVTLSVSGSESSGDVRYPALGTIDQDRYGFAGNPYYQTIDFDLVSNDNISGTVYVYDNSGSSPSSPDVNVVGGGIYRAWNGTAGSLTNGLIAPFQGFVVTASGGSGYITIQTADKSSTAGTFYRTLDGESEGNSYLEFTTADGGYSKSWLSFRQDGDVGQDDRDAKRLMPLMASSRLVSLTHNGDNSLDINNVPFEHEGTISIPLDVMSLTLEEENYVTGTSEVSMSWNLDNLPEHIDLTLVDNLTGEMVYLNNEMSHTFTTDPKGSFSATYEEAVGIYPILGDARFSLQVSYGALDNAPVKVIPKDYALSPVYPNPFNPSATVRFDVPEVSRVELQVYDVTGKLVETLLDDRMTAGQHQYTWQPQELATGTYFLRLITANQTFTQKVTYVK